MAPADTLPNDLKIVFFGSSVPFGQGATLKYGYPARYAALLAQRAASGQGAAWTVANISVPGDNTTKVAARWRRDLRPQHGRYVVLALSLGNEGIHGGGQPVFEQFKTNLLGLVQRARAEGLVPVVANCYTRNDYTPEDYAFIRQMNLLLHAWAVPTINTLGAVDDGTGHWAPGYWDDALHPNNRGHAELAHAIVPSLFDALRTGKATPHRSATSYVRLGPGQRGAATGLALRPETLLHPFTQVFSFRTVSTGQLVTLQDSTARGSVSIGAGGGLTYISAKGGHLSGAQRVNDNRWHQLALTHYYAAGQTVLYLDGTEVGRLPEQLLTRELSLGGPQAPRGGQYRNWLFYRAGMNADELHALAADSLLKSSLELYAPLDGRRTHLPDSLINLAQSTNHLLPLTSRSLSPTLQRQKKATKKAPR
jgi:lysophospholipase L1-like esterase